VLKSAKDPQAASVLQAAHRLLLGRANKIEEISARETYLERVTIHQLIMAEAADCIA